MVVHGEIVDNDSTVEKVKVTEVAEGPACLRKTSPVIDRRKKGLTPQS